MSVIESGINFNAAQPIRPQEVCEPLEKQVNVEPISEPATQDICNFENSPFTLVEQHDLVTVLHYEGHPENNERFDIRPHILTVLAMFYK